jgi:hypothetical protein
MDFEYSARLDSNPGRFVSFALDE